MLVTRTRKRENRWACGNQQNHERVVQEVYNRLTTFGHYSWVKKNVNYSHNGYDGEIDVLAYDEPHNTYYFYEIKSNPHGHVRRGKAYDQFRRYRRAYRGRHVRGVYVYPDLFRGANYLHAERMGF